MCEFFRNLSTHMQILFLYNFNEENKLTIIAFCSGFNNLKCSFIIYLLLCRLNIEDFIKSESLSTVIIIILRVLNGDLLHPLINLYNIAAFVFDLLSYQWPTPHNDFNAFCCH